MNLPYRLFVVGRLLLTFLVSLHYEVAAVVTEYHEHDERLRLLLLACVLPKIEEIGEDMFAVGNWGKGETMRRQKRLGDEEMSMWR